jgi:hypothetical protein
MAIKCNCPAKCEIHPKPTLVDVLKDPENAPAIKEAIGLAISAEDKLMLKILEAKSLNSQLQYRDAGMRAQSEHQQLQQFAAAMFEKHNLKQQDYVLDLSQMEFTPRPKA